VFDYGCPDDVDPLDRRLWHTWHPGLAYGLTDYDALDMALGDGAAAFVREYGNVWTRTAAGRTIPEDDWRHVQHTSDMPPGRLCVALDVAFDGDTAAVVLAGPHRHLELVDVLPVDEATRRAFELHRRYGAPIALDKYGPTAGAHDELAAAGAELLEMTAYDVALAAAAFLRGVKARDVSVWPHPALDDAVELAATKPLGDGWKWSRRISAGSIAPLVAATNALWGLEHLPPAKRAPVAHA